MPTPRQKVGESALGPVFDYLGRPDQAVASHVLQIPRLVELHGGRICYKYRAEDANSDSARTSTGSGKVLHMPLSTTANPRVLDGFLKLAEGHDKSVLGFARRWGVLDLCRHGFPVGQRTFRHGYFDHRRIEICDPEGWGPLGLDSAEHAGSEDIKFWRAWAVRARALLRIAVALHANRPGEPKDWLPWFDDSWPASNFLTNYKSMLTILGKDITVDGQWLRLLVNEWVAIGGFAPSLVSPEGGPTVIRFTSGQYGRLFGVIGFQMMIRISRVGRWTICSGCGDTYTPSRAPASHRSNFCEECGRPAALRFAKKRMSEKKRRVRALFTQRVPIDEIARSVGSKQRTVRGWLKNKSRSKRAPGRDQSRP